MKFWLSRFALAGVLIFSTGNAFLLGQVAEKEAKRSSGSWGQFRGPSGMGVVLSDQITTKLDPKEGYRWRTPLQGVGWSSPVTDGRVIWLTSAIASEATEEQKAAAVEKFQMTKMKEIAGSLELLVQCLDLRTGELLLERKLADVDQPKPIHPMNSYASPTAAISGDRVICHFGGYGTWCLDVQTGEELWNRRMVVDDSVGPGSSPVIVDDKVLLTCDGTDQQFIAALSMGTGEICWKTHRPKMRTTNGEFQKAYCTPLIVQIEGRQQAVIPGAQWCIAYDPTNGDEIWRFDHGGGFSVTPMAILADGKLVFSTGFTSPELVCLDPTGRGDVTSTHVLWRTKRNAPTKPSLVSDHENLYVISDDGILSSVSLETGETLWRKRIGGTFSASPIISGSKVFIGNHDGDMTIFKSGDEYAELGQVAFGEQIMASPMVVGNDIVIRTKAAVYRFDAD
ncbi:MAG: PQQ-binding-like beta-propeller repeat protein [Pirellulaceae bacterium]